MGKYKTYEKYNPSGVEWLGEIPEHWQVQKLKYSSYLKGRIGWQNLRSDEFTDEGPYLITGMHFKDGSVDWDACYHITQERYNMAPEIHVKEHDILITKDGSIGKLAYIDYLPGLASLNSHLLLIRPTQKQYLPRYLYYLLGSAAFEVYTLNEQKGTTFYGISQHSIANFPAIFPSFEEQKQIARFLDRETTRIDTLITKKRQLIDLLQKKRDAIIYRAVTQGLQPNQIMKDSNTDWLGKIPEDWKTPPLCYVCDLTAGGTPDRNNSDYWNGDIPWVKTGEINYENIKETEEYITELGLINSSAKIAPPGTLLMAMYGQGVTRGRVAILDIEAAFNQACLAITPHTSLNIKYLYYYLINAYSYIRDLGNLTSQMNLSLGYIAKLKILLPSLDEQKGIASFLDKITQHFSKRKQKLHESLEELEKYRTALITAAVTGKIDVREEAD